MVLSLHFFYGKTKCDYALGIRELNQKTFLIKINACTLQYKE